MHKHLAKQFENGVFLLVRDGNFCQCPKTMIGLPQQGINGVELKPSRIECSTICPFASIVEKETFKESPETGGSVADGKKYFYVIECEGGRKEIQLDNLVTRLTVSKNGGLIKT